MGTRLQEEEALKCTICENGETQSGKVRARLNAKGNVIGENTIQSTRKDIVAVGGGPK